MRETPAEIRLARRFGARSLKGLRHPETTNRRPSELPWLASPEALIQYPAPIVARPIPRSDRTPSTPCCSSTHSIVSQEAGLKETTFCRMEYIGDHQQVLKRCYPAVQRAIKWAHPANLSRAIGERGGATGRKNVGHTTIAATRSTSRSTQTAAAHRSEPGSRGVGSDNCERTTPSARRLRVTQREYSDSLTLDSGRCEHRLHNAVSLLRDLSACIVDEAHFGLSLRLGVHGHS